MYVGNVTLLDYTEVSAMFSDGIYFLCLFSDPYGFTTCQGPGGNPGLIRHFWV